MYRYFLKTVFQESKVLTDENIVYGMISKTRNYFKVLCQKIKSYTNTETLVELGSIILKVNSILGVVPPP